MSGWELGLLHRHVAWHEARLDGLFHGRASQDCNPYRECCLRICVQSNTASMRMGGAARHRCLQSSSCCGSARSLLRANCDTVFLLLALEQCSWRGGDNLLALLAGTRALSLNPLCR